MTDRLDCSWELAQEAVNFVRIIAIDVVEQEANAGVVLGPGDTAFLRHWITRFDALNAAPPPPKGKGE